MLIYFIAKVFRFISETNISSPLSFYDFNMNVDWAFVKKKQS